MRQDTSTPGSNRVRNVIAGITLGLSAFSFGAKASEVRAEEVIAAQTKAQSSLEISFKQRNWLKSASKDLARLGLIDEARYLLDLLKESDISGRYERDNKRLEIQLRTEFGKSLGLSKLQREQRTESARKELKKFSSELFEQASSADFYTQEKALRILRRIDSESEETLKLEQAVNSKRRDPQNSQYDIASVTESFQQIAELNLGFRIESGVEKGSQVYFNPKKPVNFASYADKSGGILKIQSTVLSKEDLELLVHELVRAVTLFNGVKSQNWEIPTVGGLSVLMLDKQEAANAPLSAKRTGSGLLFSTGSPEKQASTKLFTITIDESCKLSPMIQENEAITAYIGSMLQADGVRNVPVFLRIGLLDFISREITRVNAGAAAEIKRSLGGLSIGFSSVSNIGLRTLLFSRPTEYKINHEELRAVNSPDLSLSNFFTGAASASEGLGRLAAVRVVQFLYEHKYLKEFIARASAVTGNGRINFQEILEAIAGKKIVELESDFKTWANRINLRERKNNGLLPDNPGIIQRLEQASDTLVRAYQRKPILQDVSEQARSILPIIKAARDAFYGKELDICESDMLNEGCRLHNFYSKYHDGGSYGHDEERDSDYFTYIGASAGNWGALWTGSSTLDQKFTVDAATIYHWLDLFHPNTVLIGGLSNYENSSVTIGINFEESKSFLEKQVYFWPPKDATGVTVYFGTKSARGESPSPAPGYEGYPVKILFKHEVPTDVDAKLYKISKSGERIEVKDVKVLTPYNDPNNFLRDVVALIPRYPLEYNTSYEAEVTGTGIDTHTSRFTTESKPK